MEAGLHVGQLLATNESPGTLRGEISWQGLYVQGSAFRSKEAQGRSSAQSKSFGNILGISESIIMEKQVLSHLSREEWEAIRKAWHNIFMPSFWRRSQYNSHEEAWAQGGVYGGGDANSYSAYADAMACCRAVADCIEHRSSEVDIVVHLVIDGKYIGDFALNDCY